MPEETPAAPALKVERSTVTKLVITGAPRLDPITVFLEDFGLRDAEHKENPNYKTGAGKITITCWGGSWTAYWGGMGPRTVAQFVAGCGWDYVLNCLDRGISSTRFTGDALATLARKCILERRRCRNLSDWEEGSLDAEDARRLFNRIDDLRNIESTNECWHHSKLLTELFGEEWRYPVGDRALEENHKFTYLQRIVEAVQEALRQEQKQVTP